MTPDQLRADIDRSLWSCRCLTHMTGSGQPIHWRPRPHRPTMPDRPNPSRSSARDRVRRPPRPLPPCSRCRRRPGGRERLDRRGPGRAPLGRGRAGSGNRPAEPVHVTRPARRTGERPRRPARRARGGGPTASTIEAPGTEALGESPCRRAFITSRRLATTGMADPGSVTERASLVCLTLVHAGQDAGQAGAAEVCAFRHTACRNRRNSDHLRG